MKYRRNSPVKPGRRSLTAYNLRVKDYEDRTALTHQRR